MTEQSPRRTRQETVRAAGSPKAREAQLDRLRAKMALLGWKCTRVAQSGHDQPAQLTFEYEGRGLRWFLEIGAVLVGFPALALLAVVVVAFVSWRWHAADVARQAEVTAQARARILDEFKATLQVRGYLPELVQDPRYDPDAPPHTPDAMLLRAGPGWERQGPEQRQRLVRQLWTEWRRANPHRVEPERVPLRVLDGQGNIVGAAPPEVKRPPRRP